MRRMSIDERRKSGWIALCVAAALFPLSGCAAYPDSAWEQLKTAKSDYQNHYYGAAARKLDEIVDHYPNHPDSAEAYYVRALCYARLSQKVYAEADARQCIKL
ncbi:MAG: outer membrane protein assembly factor BamD, partial [Phycisphaerae bacterium]